MHKIEEDGINGYQNGATFYIQGLFSNSSIAWI